MWLIYVIIICAIIKEIAGSSRSITRNIPARSYQEVLNSLPLSKRSAYAHYHRESIKAIRKTRRSIDIWEFAIGFVFLFFSLGGFYFTISAIMHPTPFVDETLGSTVMFCISTAIMSVAFYCFRDSIKDLKDIHNQEEKDRI